MSTLLPRSGGDGNGEQLALAKPKVKLPRRSKGAQEMERKIIHGGNI
jgi:hypothetical protein